MSIDLFHYRDTPNYVIGNILETSKGSKYSIEDRIASGGNAVVHKCVEQSTGNEYAIKFLMKDSNKRKKRFIEECSILEKLNHNHIIKYFDSGKLNAVRKARNRSYKKQIKYLIMELADGGDLKTHINKKIKIAPEIYLAQFRGLSESLKHLHSLNFIHRDIKPENILVVGDRWVLSDFGLTSPLNRTGRDLTGDENLGPRFWMSPEMTNRCLGIRTHHAEINKASDVFQLASVFWYIVNKRHPSGILEMDDWIGLPFVYKVLRKALDHCESRRFKNGSEFYTALIDSIEN